MKHKPAFPHYHSEGMLTPEQYLELLIGPKGLTSAFDCDESRESGWRSHAAELTAMVAPGSRPWAWWQYDAPTPALPREPDLTYLMRCDLLTEREQDEFDLTAVAQSHAPFAGTCGFLLILTTKPAGPA